MRRKFFLLLTLLAVGPLEGQEPATVPAKAAPSKAAATKPAPAKSTGVTKAAGAPAAARPEAVPTAKPGSSEKEGLTAEKDLGVGFREPPLYYLKDRQGQLQPVPGFGFEEFVELYRLQQQLEGREQKPRVVLDDVSVEGQASADRADLAIRIKVLLGRAGWTRVPLRLTEGLLTAPAECEGSAEHFVEWDSGGEGYVAWLCRTSPGPCLLKLKMLVPLVSTGTTNRLRLSFPVATGGQMKLRVGVAKAAATLSEGATLEAAVADKEGTALQIIGLRSDFEVSWFPQANPVIEGPQLEVIGALLSRVEVRQVSHEAQLKVRSLGRPFERFHVRLPESANLIPADAANYSVAELPKPPSGAQEGNWVEVRLARKTLGPVNVRLTARRICDPSRSDQWLDLAGFDVPEAIRQTGHIAVAGTGDWRMLWGPFQGTRQVAQWPEPLRYHDVIAGFEYLMQPCQLTGRLVPKRTHISVEPEYLILVDADQVRLEARLKYLVRGAKAFSLEVQLDEWEFDQVEPEYLVAVDGIAVSPGRLVSLPLTQPAIGPLELTIRAHRAIPAGTKALSLPLPQPRAAAVEPATMVVLPADNVELTPGGASGGLVRQEVAPTMTLPERQQPPLYYRSEGGKGVFSCGFRVQPQLVNAEVQNQVTVDLRSLRLEQRLTYTIAHEPLDRLCLEVPKAVSAAELQVTLEGQALPLQQAAEGKSAAEADCARFWLQLPRAVLGNIEVLVCQKRAFEEPPPGVLHPLELALVMPAGVRLTGNRLAISAAGNLRIAGVEAPWTAIDEGPRGGRARAVQWSSAQPERKALVMLQRESQETQTALSIDRAWYQIGLHGLGRQDRAVFRFHTSLRELEVFLPTGAAMPQMQAFLDSKPLQLAAPAAGRVVLSLGGEETQHPHVLELRYSVPDAPLLGRPLSMELPRLGSNTWIRRAYCQLVLPPDAHVLATPEGFTSEDRWSWTWNGWRPQPLLEQAQLENWTGVAGQSPVPEQTNRYLWSTTGVPKSCTVAIADRAALVLWGAGAVLLVGLIFLYIPASRHPGLLLVLSLALAVLGLIYPEAVAALVPAAILGLLLVVVSMIVARGLRKGQPGRGISDASRAGLEKGSTQSLRPVPRSPGPPSTESAAVPSAAATLEWHV